MISSSVQELGPDPRLHAASSRIALLEIVLVLDATRYSAPMFESCDQCILEVDRAAWPTVTDHVKNLQDHVEDVGCAFSIFVEQHDLERPPPHGFGQRAALPRSRHIQAGADQRATDASPCTRSYQRTSAACREQKRGKRFCQLGLATPVGPKHERADRRFGSCNPARARAGCETLRPLALPITRFDRPSSILRSFSRSPSTSLSTGTPVHARHRRNVAGSDRLFQNSPPSPWLRRRQILQSFGMTA